MVLEPGVRLGHFELVGLLGRGGMGEVWRAQDLRLGREVAVKLMPERLADDPEYVSRFEVEARALAALNHPNVAQIFELAEVPARPGTAELVRVIVMELVEGETVAQHLQRGPLPPAQALGVALQVAQALRAVHARGVVHRDLKPANIVLSPAGDAKVLDFGLARLRSPWRAGAEVDITAKLTDSEVVVGTAAYMAPEQIRGEGCDERCDVWAFGCTVAEMLGGRRLIAGETVPEIAAHVLSGQLAWEVLPAHLPRELRRLLRECVQADPRRRPDMGAVEERLAALQTPAAARRWSWWTPLVGLGVVGLLALAVWRWPRPPVARLGSDGRLPVVVDEVRGGGDGALVARGELRRQLAASAVLEMAPPERALVEVHPEWSREGGGRLRATVEDRRSGAVLGVFEIPLGGGGDAAAAVVAALELEQVGRELERDDPYYGFQVRRTQQLAAAQAYRDGLRLAERSRNREARESFERASVADPGFWPAPLFLAMLAKGSGRFDDAHAEIARVRALLPQPGATEAVIVEAASAHVDEDNQRQLEALQRALVLFPASGNLTYRAAQSLRMQDRPEDAIPLLERLLAQGWRPDWSPTQELLANAQLLAGRTEAVLVTCAAGEERFPTRHRYPYFAACALQQLGRPAEAREALRRAIRKYVDYSGTAPGVVRQTAQYWAALLRWPEERRLQLAEWLAESERGLRDAPGDEDLMQNRAEALEGLGRPAEARDLLRPLLARPAPPVYALLTHARACHALGDDATARDALARAGVLWRARQAPALGTLAYNIATAWAALGDTREALEWLLRARDLYGVDRQDLAMDPDLDPLRQAGLLGKLPPRRPAK